MNSKVIVVSDDDDDDIDPQTYTINKDGVVVIHDSETYDTSVHVVESEDDILPPGLSSTNSSNNVGKTLCPEPKDSLKRKRGNPIDISSDEDILRPVLINNTSCSKSGSKRTSPVTSGENTFKRKRNDIEVVGESLHIRTRKKGPATTSWNSEVELLTSTGASPYSTGTSTSNSTNAPLTSPTESPCCTSKALASNEAHDNNDNAEALLVCPCCPKADPFVGRDRPESFVTHFRRNHLPNCFHCSKCAYGGKNYTDIKHHLETMHSTICPFCKNSTQEFKLSQLAEHIHKNHQEHHDGKQYVCPHPSCLEGSENVYHLLWHYFLTHHESSTMSGPYLLCKLCHDRHVHVEEEGALAHFIQEHGIVLTKSAYEAFKQHAAVFVAGVDRNQPPSFSGKENNLTTLASNSEVDHSSLLNNKKKLPSASDTHSSSNNINNAMYVNGSKSINKKNELPSDSNNTENAQSSKNNTKSLPSSLKDVKDLPSTSNEREVKFNCIIPAPEQPQSMTKQSKKAPTLVISVPNATASKTTYWLPDGANHDHSQSTETTNSMAPLPRGTNHVACLTANQAKAAACGKNFPKRTVYHTNGNRGKGNKKSLPHSRYTQGNTSHARERTKSAPSCAGTKRTNTSENSAYSQGTQNRTSNPLHRNKMNCDSSSTTTAAESSCGGRNNNPNPRSSHKRARTESAPSCVGSLPQASVAAGSSRQVLSSLQSSNLPSDSLKNLSTFSHIIFIDLDNWGKFFSLPYPLSPKIFVWGFCGGNYANKKEWSPHFRALVVEKRFFQHPKCGKSKNAADFALCVQAARLDLQLPVHIPFTVLSGDNGFDELRNQLKSSARQIHLVDPHKKAPDMLYALLMSIGDK